MTGLGRLAADNFILVSAAAALLVVWLVSIVFNGPFPPAVIAYSRSVWLQFIFDAAAIPVAIWYLSRPRVNERLVACVVVCAMLLVAMFVVSAQRMLIVPFIAIELYFIYDLIRRLNETVNGKVVACVTIAFVVIGGWFVSAAMTGEYVFDKVLTGATDAGTGLSMTLALLAGTLIASTAFVPSLVSNSRTRIVDAIAVIVFAIASVRRDVGFSGDDHHTSFFLGPADLVRHGGTLLWNVASQYGILNVWLMGHMPFPDSYSAFVYLSATLTFATVCCLYAALRTIYRSPYAAAASLAASFSLVFILAGSWWVGVGFEHYPQVSGIRWIWAYAFLALLLFSYVKDSPRIDRYVLAGGNVMWLLAVCWSAESGIYATCMWSVGSALIALRRFGPRGIAATWAMGIALLVVMMGVLEIASRIHTGHGLDWFMYIEFGMLYQGGQASWPFETQSPFWMLVGVFGIMIGLAVTLYRNGRERALPLAIALCMMLWATGSYFIMRSHPNNVNNLTQFSIAALAIGLYLSIKEQLDERLSLTLRLVPIPIIAVALGLTFGPWQFQLALHDQGWTKGPIGDYSFYARSLAAEGPDVGALMKHVKPGDPVSFLIGNAIQQLPPSIPGTPGLVPETLPILPPLLVGQLPIPRIVTIIQRYAKDFPQGGYLVDRAGVVDTVHIALDTAGTAPVVARSGPFVLRKWSAVAAKTP